MRAYGSDRLTIAADGTVQLTSPVPKDGWTARMPRTTTSVEHPGTAVLWDGTCHEVIAIEPLSNGVRYTLAPWRDERTMRVTQTYDEATERARAAERTDVRRRRKNRRLAIAFGVFTGHLPGRIQQRLANEYGANAPILTITAAIAECLVAALILDRFVRATIDSATPPSIVVGALGAFLFLDGAIRFGVAWLESRPIGSLPGLVAYSLVFALHPDRRRMLPPLELEQTSPGTTRPQATLSAHDKILMWEPALTLLSVQEQRRLELRFGFDPNRYAKITAAFILAFSILGAVSAYHQLSAAPRPSAYLSLITATLLAGEQIVRLVRLGGGPAPSILRFLVRPFVRRTFF